MRRPVTYLALIGFALASLVFAPTAQAHGDPEPVPRVPGAARATCSVIGQATVFVDASGHGNYQFVTTTISCVYTTGAVVSYDVSANGESWGPILPSTTCPGPGVCDGWSPVASWSSNAHGSYANPCGEANNANKGNIAASDGSGTAAGWLKFTRRLTQVVAWGTFCTGSGSASGRSFYANLEFSRVNPVGDPTVYDLRGDAIIY